MPQATPLPSRSVAHFSFLSAIECDFRHPDDGRKWRIRCKLKRQICRGYAKLGLTATECQLSQFLHIPERTVGRWIAILIKQGFVSNVRRRWHGPILRKLHKEKLSACEFS